MSQQFPIGVMDSTLACGPGLIPTVGKSIVCNIQMVFSRYEVVGKNLEPATIISVSI